MKPGTSGQGSRQKPRYVTGEVSLDDSVAEQLTGERPNDFNMGLDTTKALYYPHDAAYPALHVLDREALSDADAATLTEECPPGAIDLDMEEKEFHIDVGAIIVATGWRGYDPANLPNLGFGRCPDVVYEPDGGAVLRPQRAHGRKDPPALEWRTPGERGVCPVCRIQR